jgi:translation initiation factor 2B subunit (eIF-2B alpha/beta/delta family)
VDISCLVDALRDGSLVAFVGSGASQTYTDPQIHHTYAGLPASGDIVRTMAERRKYIGKSLSFPEACFLLKRQESRGQLEKLLLEAFDRPVVKPLPAHVILANLPFTAFITTNYDQLLERALREGKRNPFVIIRDDDVSRLRSLHLPVVKVHGCVSLPESMIAAEDEFVPLSDSKPIVGALLMTILAKKTVLFLGFSLQDYDFRLVFQLVKRLLGDRMPKSYAVLQGEVDYNQQYWEAQGVDIVNSDLTEFLRSLLRASAEHRHPTIYHPGEDWINNAFFASLLRIRSLPSETQVIDAFLEHLLQEIASPSLRLEDILTRAQRAASLVLEQRPNFEALRGVVDGLIATIRSTCSNNDQAALVVHKLIAKRTAVGSQIGRRASEVIRRGDSILIFSQSMRVAQFLSGVPRGMQETCHVYVAECRPKSPDHFQDAIAFCEALRSCGYEITIIPDAAIANLIQRNQVHRILLGAHAVFSFDGKYHSIVNTCGSAMITVIAKEYKVPVYVIAEALKVRELSKEDAVQEVSYEEEEDIFTSVQPVISDLKASGQRVGALNVGYDLCPIFDNVTVILENEEHPSA